MDSIPLDVIASSVPFRFLVGPNEREFTMHSALFTHQSPVLERLANGNFTEAAEKCVKWKSVDEDTFIRFWEYAYTGKYTAAEPVIIFPLQWDGPDPLELQRNPEATPELPSGPPPPPLAPLFDTLRSPSEDGTPEDQKRQDLWNAFTKPLTFDSFAMFHAFFIKRTKPLPTNLRSQDFTDTFLSHVRLYIFAECYDIASLMQHSLTELQAELERFTLHKQRTGDVITLVRYCYENPVPEALTDLVTLYAACKINTLWQIEQFRALVEAHSELSMALFGLEVIES
ncbi:uncharacterized protein TRIVIDRAFT_61610 [Trichoderma virens Gv29-8]|uniref:BTB domain-containing protein n=1 Tax=Hypocrea virens (strain Gv29-8 / FGSC 10586) TaxID=413071 RepID=G9MKV6_HYPVG|nr:uncharacterized protein TRIVIDRAFT_61610 [Trichoderma virens Gv29-8]EHK24852.1 hypothetical protein TRIVIDRAFT_61610 [Trichoderma virens Gv29-8]UKZ55117.1 hypothetical protein TrVGV298_008934 [Trichoderma virens]